MNKKHKVDGYPGIEVVIKHQEKIWRLYLSALYGSYNIDCKWKIPKGTIVRFSCPHCNADLSSYSLCEQCNAPMVAFYLTSGGRIQICSRRGCKKHFIEFEELEVALRNFYETYNTFFSAVSGKKEK
jgi:predicted RNA-binding Zn-ribbon protein involved in translation (DUF1610 family)